MKFNKLYHHYILIIKKNYLHFICNEFNKDIECRFTKKNENIYDLIENFYYLLNNDNWIKNYIFWELELFKYLGYDLNFRDLVEKRLLKINFSMFQNP